MKRACEAVSRLASEKLERKLSCKEQWQLRLHTVMCAACRHYASSISKLHHSLHLRQKVLSNATLPTDKREKIKQVIQDLPNS